jgi:hypothetical protein
LKRHLEREVGPERQQRYWMIFEQLRTADTHCSRRRAPVMALSRYLTSDDTCATRRVCHGLMMLRYPILVH